MKKRQEGTFSEIFDDWKWILSYSKRYKGAILYDTIIGIAGTLLGILSAIASKYLIDIITGYDASRFGLLLIIMITSSVLNLLFSSLLTRISAKISLRIYQDIQLDIFEKIIDSDWLELNKYSSGDILNRFNNDVKTVADNAITWLPAIVINVFHFIAVFCVIFHYDAKMAFLALSGAPLCFLSPNGACTGCAIILKRCRRWGAILWLLKWKPSITMISSIVSASSVLIETGCRHGKNSTKTFIWITIISVSGHISSFL